MRLDERMMSAGARMENDNCSLRNRRYFLRTIAYSVEYAIQFYESERVRAEN